VKYLQEKYEAKSRDFKKLVLLKKIMSIKKEDNENMDEFFTRIKKV
jgi:hypothetical protein